MRPISMHTNVIKVYLELSYSKSRKNELKQAGQKDCPLLIQLLQEILEKNHASNIVSYVPKYRDRLADIVFEFDIDRKSVDDVADQMRQVGGDNISILETYLLWDDVKSV